VDVLGGAPPAPELPCSAGSGRCGARAALSDVAAARIACRSALCDVAAARAASAPAGSRKGSPVSALSRADATAAPLPLGAVGSGATSASRTPRKASRCERDSESGDRNVLVPARDEAGSSAYRSCPDAPFPSAMVSASRILRKRRKNRCERWFGRGATNCGPLSSVPSMPLAFGARCSSKEPPMAASSAVRDFFGSLSHQLPSLRRECVRGVRSTESVALSDLRWPKCEPSASGRPPSFSAP